MTHFFNIFPVPGLLSRYTPFPKYSSMAYGPRKCLTSLLPLRWSLWLFQSITRHPISYSCIYSQMLKYISIIMLWRFYLHFSSFCHDLSSCEPELKFCIRINGVSDFAKILYALPAHHLHKKVFALLSGIGSASGHFEK